MTFTEADRRKAMAIVRVFETGKASGDYAALAVLDDGAGISYGINQFTHRSGALVKVVEKYFANDGRVGRAVIEEKLPLLKRKTASAIREASMDARLRAALRAAAISAEMRAAQNETAEELYLQPAIDVCTAMEFSQPLSLVVVYDSLTHGSWEKVRDRVPFTITPNGVDLTQERLWITTYVRKRDAWLASVKRLAATRYRTQFFLKQIAVSNWELKLPVVVHGVRLTCADLIDHAASGVADKSVRVPKVLAAGPPAKPADDPARNSTTAKDDQPSTTEVRPPNAEGCFEKVEAVVDAASQKFDRVEAVVSRVVTRTDAAKSLWTMIAGTIWQTLWGIVGFFAGLPKEVWLVVALIAAALMLGYLYRQIVLGKIRELSAAE